MECAALDELLRAVRTGESGTLVLRGEAGIGKSALLDYAAAHAEGCEVVRATGVESEMELPFATLHQLCLPLLERGDRLPAPQAAALRTAFGLSSGQQPDRLLVGLAVLSLLADAAEARPLVGLVDDAQWLDRSSRQVLSFVARRLQAESVILVFAARDNEREDELAGLPELRLQGLSTADARELFASAAVGPLDERVRDRIIAETRGNPLALLELPRGLPGATLGAGFEPPDLTRLPSGIQASYRRQVAKLPKQTQQLLLVAAAEPIGDPMLLWRAVGELGIPAEAAAPAEAEGLLALGARVSFRHPLLRSAVYRGALPEDRRAAHRVLANVTNAEADPDRRAWHRAQAALAPDEDVADELVRSADRAQARGGLAAAGAFLERAAQLTPDVVVRGTRALAAAETMFYAGAPDAATALLATAQLSPLNALDRARLERLRAQVAFARRRGADALPPLLEAARRLDALDPALARETHLDALAAAVFAGRFAGTDDVREAAEAALAAPVAPGPVRALDLLLDGLGVRITRGYEAALEPLRRALRAFADEPESPEGGLRWLWLVWEVANELWDDEAWHEVTTRAVRFARDTGALAVLPIALLYRAAVQMGAGDFAAASALVDEATAITEATGNTPLTYVSPVLAAFRGDEERALSLIHDAIRDAAARGEGRAVTVAEYARAVLYNGLGRYGAAQSAAERASERDDLGLVGWVLTELVEAATRNGRRNAAIDAFQRLERRTSPAATTWARGIEAYSRALVSDGKTAEAHYREAIECLSGSHLFHYRARARLLYGEWLRREGRRSDAREHLRSAVDLFDRMGAEAFAERSRRELVATGETIRNRRNETRDQLTAQEEQIARLAADGQTNQEIAVQLFLSVRTVEWHLRKIFARLGINSRRQLLTALRETVVVA